MTVGKIHRDSVPVEMIKELIDESYRAVAPAKLQHQLDAGPSPTPKVTKVSKVSKVSKATKVTKVTKATKPRAPTKTESPKPSAPTKAKSKPKAEKK